MKTLIAYGTKHGCSQKCAMELSRELKDKIEIVNLRDKINIDLSKYDRVVLGGSVYIGRIQKEVTDFISGNLEKGDRTIYLRYAGK